MLLKKFNDPQVLQPLSCLQWNPKKDLIAVQTEGQQLILYRLDEMAQVLDQNSQADMLAWHPNGKQI